MKIEVYKRCDEMPQCGYLADNAPIFSQQIWADWLKKIEGRDVYWLVGEDGIGSLILPLAVQKKSVFKIGQFQTGIITIPPDHSEGNAFGPPKMDDDTRLGREQEFLNSVVAFIKKERLCDWVSSPPNWGLFDVWPDGSEHAPFGTYLIDLQSKTEDELFANFRKDCRNKIRRATKDGVEVISGPEQLDVVYEMMLNVAKKNRQFIFDHSHYKAMLSHFKDHMLLYAAYYEDEPQIGKFRLFSKYSSYGMGAGRIDQTAKGAGNLTTWVEMQDLKAMGVKYYDFLGARINPDKNSKQYSIQVYKESFGAELKAGHLWKQSFNPMKSFIYDSMLRVKLSFSGVNYKGDVIDQEG